MEMITVAVCAVETVSKRLDKLLTKLGITIKIRLSQKTSWQHGGLIVIFRTENVGDLPLKGPWTVCSGLRL